MKIREIVTTTVLTLALIIISTTTAAALSCGDGDICVNQSGWWRDGGLLNASDTPIQAAVDNATAGETICVAAGSYTENVDIATAHLTLAGEGAGVVTVTAVLSSDHVFEVTADYVNISGFTATGATGSAGIYLNGADHCNISENNASNNYYGIGLQVSSDNTLLNNTASANTEIGIGLEYSSDNTLLNNTASENNETGIALFNSGGNNITNNTANSNNYCGIGLSCSDYNNISDNTANSSDYGIGLKENSRYNNISDNTANSNDYGIGLEYSTDNTLTENHVSDNYYYGIGLSSSSGNLIYNNYFNNTNNAWDNGNNQWNITNTAGTNIIGGPFLGGNYWNDYAGVDNDDDGLGDTLLPYNSAGDITNGGDYHPLVPCADDTIPPVITITIPTPYGLYTVGMELNYSATDDESGVATIVGNLTNTSDVSQTVDSGFAPPVGVYTLVVTATDNAGNTNVSDPVFFVVYDPDGSHATGGGWFYPDGDEGSLSPDGNANFGFTARYKNDVSTGKLNFQYEDTVDDIHLRARASIGLR